MLDVKKIILLNLFLFFSYISISQELIGKYHIVDPSLIIADVGIIYNFKRDGNFEQINYGYLEEKTISGGKFSIASDTLILKYNNQGKNSLSEVKVEDKEDLNSSDILSAQISVFNSKGKPQGGVNLLLQNAESEIVTGFSSDEAGKFPPILIYDDYIQFLTLSFLAHDEIRISTDTLFGFRTNIKVNLVNFLISYHNEEKTIKFIITKKTSEGLELKNLISTKDERIILQKMD